MQVVSPGVLSSLVSAIRSAIDVPWIAPLVPGFNPDDLFGVGDVGGVFDVGRMDLCYQDLAGTIPVTALGQTVLSIRARNNPAFLLQFNPIYDPVPCIYALDPQGYPYLFDPSLVSTQWTVYGQEDAGAPLGIDAYTAILCGIGTYDDSNNTLGAGSTVIGDTSGAASPYSYSGVYATETPVGSDTFIVTGSLTADATSDILPYTGESLDARPFVFAVRVTDGAQTMQINLEIEGEYTSVEAPYPAPVGIRVWVGARGGWYGGVVIGRWLDDTETLHAQEWSASLSGISLSPWTPLNLFSPGDIGGFYNSKIQSSLFQTRAGPVSPVTAEGQPTDFVVDLGGQFSLARPVSNVGFVFNGEGKITPVASNALNSQLLGAVLPALSAVTIVQSGYVDMPALNATSNNHTFARSQILNGPGSVGVQLSATRNGLDDFRIIMLGGGVGRVGDIRPVVAEFDDPYVFGGLVDFVAGEQKLFFNDTESLFSETVVPPTGVGFSLGAGLFADAAAVPLWTSAAFFINRWLSDAELARLKEWMRDNAPAP